MIRSPTSATITRRLWQELDLLCRTRVGIAPIAADLAAVLRRLVGADATALFWLDEKGLPDGFFHEDSPAAVQDLFLNEFERLFVGERELNVFALARKRDARIGHLLAPGKDYFQSNTYNLLVRESGHRHTLDLRVDAGGRPRVVVLLFRTQGPGFGENEAKTLERIAPYLEQALCRALAPEEWLGEVEQTGHLLIDTEQSRIVLLDDDAVAMLRHANQRGAGINLGQRPDAVPQFLRHLLPQAADRLHRDRQLRLPIPGGALLASARFVHAPDTRQTSGLPNVLVELRRIQPHRVNVVRKVLSLKLSPLQREIAVLAGLGHPRADCATVIGVSHEALKKHLRVVFAATGTQDWDSLGRTLNL